MRKTMLALTALASTIGTALAARTLSTDSTLVLLSEGYGFIPSRCKRYRSDAFETRLMLRRAVCMTGQEAAEVFYEPDRFTRKGALPQSTLRLLQDLGSVHFMDGEAHRHRKRMFMSLMSPGNMEWLADAMADRWRARIGGWEAMDEVVLFPEAEEICAAPSASAPASR